jgi:basic amino acid/polyamine antiporter, APA family
MSTPAHQLQRRLGSFDATMIVMGGIIGAGIFINPFVVARQLHTPLLILTVWVAGGVLALAGAFVYAELGARLPSAGGQYVYLREAWHPALAFLYGWTLLLVVQSGGMAAVAMTFSHYFVELSGVTTHPTVVAVSALFAVTLVNCLGVRTGSTTQNVLMVLKILAIAVLVAAAFGAAGATRLTLHPLLDRPPTGHLLLALGAAMTPVIFAYGGWHTASFVAGEMRNPERDLARGLVLGVAGVVTIYLAVNVAYLHVLGADGLAATPVPASEVMRVAVGEAGARFIALGIAVSTLGFLAQSMLTAPRVYFAMAADGLFFRGVAKVHPRTRVPVAAIALQGGVAMVIALSGTYERILNYVVAADSSFFALTALSLFVLRVQRVGDAAAEPYRTPGHPFTTVIFAVSCFLVAAATTIRYPADSLIGLGIVLAGVPVYFLWARRQPVPGRD